MTATYELRIKDRNLDIPVIGGNGRHTGFEALKDLDSNHDGIFNNLDTAWSQAKVWKDANQDGLVNDGELLSLEQAA